MFTVTIINIKISIWKDLTVILFTIKKIPKVVSPIGYYIKIVPT